MIGSLVAALFGASVPATTAPARAPAPYYLSLGDSLAQGVQPTVRGRSVETSEGYADDIYATYRHLVRGLRLEKLGCPGETTTSMMNGGICQYGAGSSSRRRSPSCRPTR